MARPLGNEMAGKKHGPYFTVRDFELDNYRYLFFHDTFYFLVYFRALTLNLTVLVL